ncbi:uncharacterized protein V2V93DRAFT_379851 [Kockiozyma suomiensis]|uniref:uncharacterized protein n=1 Tax=Kockiozyma suomiensis TaxID=1337062 RepID=UPI0033442048
MNAASVNIWAMFCWDVVLAILLAVSFVVTTNEVDGTLDSCTWDELNPFVSNSCKRLRAALIFSLVLAGLWALNGVWRIMVKPPAAAKSAS